MKLIQRRRQPTLLGRTWPAIVGLVIAINLLLVARSVISRIPQGDIKVVKSSKGTSSSVKGSNGGASTGSSGSEAGTSAKLPPPPRSCRMERNAEYDGEIVLKDGKQNIKRSAEECCAACHKLPMCNAW